MNKKFLINILGSLFIFLISFIIHNLYEIFPNTITAIFSPVNESVFEHMKLFLTSYTIWLIIKHKIYSYYNIKENNFLIKEVITMIINIIMFLIIYLPIYYNFGENLLVTLLIYFLTILISNTINYFVRFKKDYKYLKVIGITLIILMYITTTYFTYNPLKNSFFIDPTNNSYGLNK